MEYALLVIWGIGYSMYDCLIKIKSTSDFYYSYILMDTISSHNCSERFCILENART